ncbi:MAG TPA: DUF2231 domain-containing protein [Burkholderiaceae bacterium]|nr:DUF2231 domain-containing protein [Burkholderiaceae bacterium]
MESKARLFGHSVHQSLVAFPVGLLITAVVFDAIALLGGNAALVLISYRIIGAGLIAAAIAAPFGLIDLLAVPRGTRAARIGVLHAVGNVIVLLAFIGSWVLRWQHDGLPTVLALLLSFAGAALLLVTGWLGGELVSRMGIGVLDGAHPNAPSSLDRHAPMTVDGVPDHASVRR